ncbi:MAG TPA: DUF5615 family PIN-like protein [Gemmatirosa sp.]
MNFLFDNNMPAPLAAALRLLNKPVSHVRDLADLGAAAPDDLILDYALRWDYLVVTIDRAMRKTPHFRALLQAKGLGVFFVKTGGARQMNAWQIAQLVVKAWDAMEQHAAQHRRPFIALVQPNGRVLRD